MPRRLCATTSAATGRPIRSSIDVPDPVCDRSDSHAVALMEDRANPSGVFFGNDSRRWRIGIHDGTEQLDRSHYIRWFDLLRRMRVPTLGKAKQVDQSDDAWSEPSWHGARRLHDVNAPLGKTKQYLRVSRKRRSWPRENRAGNDPTVRIRGGRNPLSRQQRGLRRSMLAVIRDRGSGISAPQTWCMSVVVRSAKPFKIHDLPGSRHLQLPQKRIRFRKKQPADGTSGGAPA